MLSELDLKFFETKCQTDPAIDSKLVGELLSDLKEWRILWALSQVSLHQEANPGFSHKGDFQSCPHSNCVQARSILGEQH